MAKKFGIIIISLICAVLLTACGCEHVWLDATCLAPATCKECGKTEGELGDHIWQDATCETPKTCATCGEIEGEAVGHKWTEAACETSKECEVCGKSEGEPLGHSWDGGGCVKVCTRCNEEKAEHTWEEATCKKVKTCKECSTTEGDLADHDWLQADCDNPERCSWCGETEGEALGHSLGESGTAEIGTCVTCNKTVELYYPDDGSTPGKLAAAWTVYDIGADGLPVDPVSYVYKSSGPIVYNWVANGKTRWNSISVNGAYTAVSIYYVDGKFYYYHEDKYTYSTQTTTFLANVAKEYVDFAQSVWVESKTRPGSDSIDLMPAGWSSMMDDIGSAHLAEDVYGNQYVIVQGDGVGLFAVRRDWQGVTAK